MALVTAEAVEKKLVNTVEQINRILDAYDKRIKALESAPKKVTRRGKANDI